MFCSQSSVNREQRAFDTAQLAQRDRYFFLIFLIGLDREEEESFFK